MKNPAATEWLKEIVLEGITSIGFQMTFADEIGMGFIWGKHGYVELGAGG